MLGETHTCSGTKVGFCPTRPENVGGVGLTGVQTDRQLESTEAHPPTEPDEETLRSPKTPPPSTCENRLSGANRQRLEIRSPICALPRRISS